MQGMTKPVFVLNGPNLNLLGKREPEIYGHTTLSDIEAALRALANESGIEIDFRQTNSEGTLVDYVQEAREKASAVILNAGAYTHTSVALHDALRSLTIPVFEVHLSNPAAREPFRSVNYVAPVATATIAGLGAEGYDFALKALIKRIKSEI